nr:glutamine-dependent NAD(+) synthetase [Polyrhizophydium stewartii]
MIITLASCSLNQWALDFTGNLSRIQESIRLAKDAGAAYRLGPELEVPGYGCNDHFLEADTVEHSWEVLAALLSDPSNSGVVCDVGMPVVFRGILYNCRVIFLDGRILLIRPKMFLANDGNYREMRWFTPWAEPRKVESLRLPEMVRAVSGQDSAPFGDAVVSFADPHVKMSLDGVEVFTNGSASHHEFRKLNRRVKLICGATEKCGGVYMYANQKGCDGERVYYDGCPLIVVNGEVVAQGAQFSLDEVEVITATVDLQDVWAYRAGLVSRALQASTNHDHFPLITVDARLGVPSLPAGRTLSKPRAPKFHTPAEEIRLGPACWLWDYLRRTKAGGYFLPLSGGIDSCASALIVYSMCELVHKNLAKPGARVKSDLETVVGKPIDASSMTPASICNSILHTCYMGTVNSSAETRARATTLAESIGRTPQFRVHGAYVLTVLISRRIKARLRMVIAYLFAQLLPWTRNNRGSLLVLGSANIDEMLRGYLTKYDCSSADVNPLGGISKVDLTDFVRHMRDSVPHLSILSDFLEALPSAELEPITASHQQTDEIAAKVKRMFFFYSINRHKSTVLPPAYHMSSYSADDNRFDLRPFLYNASWSWQFKKIDENVPDSQPPAL